MRRLRRHPTVIPLARSLPATRVNKIKGALHVRWNVPAAAGFLDRERIIAGPGFNRWLVPPAALAIHLCIGMAYGFSVFWLPMSKLIPGAAASVRTDFVARTDRDRVATGRSPTSPTSSRPSSPCSASRLRSGAAGSSTLGPRKSGLIAALCWGGGLILGGYGVLDPSAVAGVPRLRLHRRHRPGTRLHHAGLDADQMVPRPPRHGDRIRHHGLWRRRNDRFTARGLADGTLRPADGVAGVSHDADGHGRHLFHCHEPRRARIPRPACGLAARRLDAGCRH